MSNSTSAKPASDDAASAGKTEEPKTPLEDSDAGTQAQSGPDETALNGSGPSDGMPQADAPSEAGEREAGATQASGAESGLTDDAARAPEDGAEAASEAAAAERSGANSADDDEAAPESDDGRLPEEADETYDAQETETLDLRALFASSEPDFASPTDTFELARGTPARTASAETAKADARDHGHGLNSQDEPDAPDRDDPFMKRGAFAARPQPQSSIDDEDGAQAFETSGADDPLADAVQSALRSVYGDNSGKEYDLDDEDERANSTGPVLQWAGGAAADRRAIADDPGEAFDGGRDAPRARESAIDDETTEAVLSYLYEHMDETDDANAAEAPSQEDAYDFDLTTQGSRQDHDPWPGSAMPADDDGEPLRDSGAELPHDRRRPAPDAPERQVAMAAKPAPAPENFPVPLDMSMDNSEASGKLLGAAGLGLIGGIAVAGVAAVFVFNSFVTQQDQPPGFERTQSRLSDGASSAPGSAAPEKDGARLGAEAAGERSSQVSPETRTASVVTPSFDDPASARREPAATSAVTRQGLRAGDVAGSADQPISLALNVPDDSAERFVRIHGLPQGVRLSAGVDTGNGSWLLSAGRADGLSLSVPPTYAGAFTLEAMVLAEDARTPVGDPVSFGVRVVEPSTPPASQIRTAAVEPPASASDAVSAALQRARDLFSAGDVAGARALLRPEAESGNAQAALALGQSYDPMTFTPDSPANAGPDATEAFRWYQKAMELGAPEGERRIGELKVWLLQ